MTSSLEIKVSPMMVQWQACKAKAPDALLLFRLGDFYEAFYDDAVILSKELDLVLTKRQEIPMSGVPAHTSEMYIDRLVDKGYRVAIAEQMEDPQSVKGLLKREIVRLITPGTVITSSLLSDKSNHFLASIAEVNGIFGLSFLDLTTAEFYVMQLEDPKQLKDELLRLKAKEILISKKFQERHKNLLFEIKNQFFYALSCKEEMHFDHKSCLDFLLRHFRLHTLDGFGLKGKIAAVNAAGALMAYIQEDLNLSTSHIKTLQAKDPAFYMSLSNTTQKHLELLEPLHIGQKNATLLELLDQTLTPMGARLIKQWIAHPLLSATEIAERQEAIAQLLQKQELFEKIKEHLKEIRDLQRLIMRIETGFASPRDLIALRFSLQQLPFLFALLASFSSPLLVLREKDFSTLSSLANKIKTSLVDEPPLRLSEGGIFKPLYHKELDELRTLTENNHSWIARYQTDLRETTKIKTLKVGFTKAFGYYIEVSRGQADKMPLSFQRRQTLVNTERFITAELKEYEHKMLNSEARMHALESELFHALRQEVASFAQVIRILAEAIAKLDCLFSLARVAKKWRYIRPKVDESDAFYLEEGRHPVVEASLEDETFIPNDVYFNEKQRLFLITGPNMAGKSTYLRQTALIAIMAQIGCFVPCKTAHIGIIDKVFSRIGASDDLSRGQSTFMVEMSETAYILHHVTSRSLVLLDEIGRGTSTYDGISIAWAVAEYLLLNKQKRAKTLFATHYWELTQLEEQLPGAANFNVAVHESEKGIVFLHKILSGGTDKSYGIHVARLAGLPEEAIKRAQERLSKLEKKVQTLKPIPQNKQMSLLPTSSEKVIEELKSTDFNTLSPLEAHAKLVTWKKTLV